MRRTLAAILLAILLQGCASVSTFCGAVTTAKLIALHSPWAIVPAIYTLGTMKQEKNIGDAILECSGTASAMW
jgi:hypothetical protein